MNPVSRPGSGRRRGHPRRPPHTTGHAGQHPAVQERFVNTPALRCCIQPQGYIVRMCSRPQRRRSRNPSCLQFNVQVAPITSLICGPSVFQKGPSYRDYFGFGQPYRCDYDADIITGEGQLTPGSTVREFLNVELGCSRIG